MSLVPDIDEGSRPVIVWFRDDLRLADHPALDAAQRSGRPLICVYVVEDAHSGVRAPGGALRWWLHQGLQALGNNLLRQGGELLLLSGQASQRLLELAMRTQAAGIFWNRRYGQAERSQDAQIKQLFREQGRFANSLPGAVLYEPWTVRPGDDRPYQVFSAYWRACQRLGPPSMPLPRPARWLFAEVDRRGVAGCTSLADLDLQPRHPDWAGGLRDAWAAGEDGAWRRLEEFLDETLQGYAEGRDFPGRDACSRLSPYLRLGHLSPRQVWHAVWSSATMHRLSGQDVDKFLSELGWRDFCYYLHYHYPDLSRHNLQPSFDAMPWRDDAGALRTWQQGRTGFPLVDAGMRELWSTGWMHNRVRMVVASFLVKHLLLDWRHGEAWFWDTLVDADAASNPASWQWVAGCGMDAAPYFRIFNPVLQGQKFDPHGDYIRRWVPELAKLPDRVLQQPWTATAAQARAAGVRLGQDYPLPCVEHALGRERALQAYAQMRGRTRPD
ncbi:cryptochrome/photolyase family protein [Frateuria aurantia]